MSKLWEKGYNLNAEIEKFTVGDDPQTDLALAKYDVQVNKAHAKMLQSIGILTMEELDALLGALDELATLVDRNEFKITQDQEDVHTAVEAFLTSKLGDVGKKIHTARSRNDQVATDLALYQLESVETINKQIAVLNETILMKVKENEDVPMPGYSHMQKAMPYTIKGWLLTYIEMLGMDQRLLTATSSYALLKNPLGSAAGYGVPIEIDKELTQRELGFTKPFIEPLAVQNCRGKIETATLSAANQVMMTLNKLATDLMLFTTTEYGYFSLPDEFCTGSSIMPQKKNYDVLELVRGKTAGFGAKMVEIQLICAGLPSGYNRDFQLLKKPLIEGIETVKSVIAIMTIVIGNLQVHKDKLQAAMTPELYATEKALKLVKGGVPFRDAYKKVAEELKKTSS